MLHHVIAGPEASVVIDGSVLTLVRPGPYSTRRDVYRRIAFKTPVTIQERGELVVITNLGHMEVFT